MTGLMQMSEHRGWNTCPDMCGCATHGGQYAGSQTIGAEMSDPYTEMMERDLAAPQFVSWTVRREARHLLEVVSHLWPDDEIRSKALRLFELACDIDDEIERR